MCHYPRPDDDVDKRDCAKQCHQANMLTALTLHIRGCEVITPLPQQKMGLNLL